MDQFQERLIARSLKQTFDLNGCRALLAKLRWEIDQIKSDTRMDYVTLSYRGYNAAVTAWHLADWIWEDMGDDQKEAVGVSNRGELQKKARDGCRAIYYCRQIATASKHFAVDDYPDPNIQAYVSASPKVTVSDSGESEIYAAWALKIMDGQERVQAVEQFEIALGYWTDLVEKYGITKIISKASVHRIGG